MSTHPSHNARNNISQSLLCQLYCKQKLSSPAIAKRLSCDPATIRNRLRCFGLHVRSYKEARRYWKFTRFPGKIQHPKRDFAGDAPQKAYLIGFRLGDLWVKKACSGPYSQTIEVHSRTTQPAQVNLFKRLFRGYGYLYQGKPDNHGAFYSVYYLNRSFDFLLPKQDTVEKWVQKDPRCAVTFAAGYIDAEGSFHVSTLKSGLKKAGFAVGSQDQNILRWMHRWFRSVAVQCRPPKLAIPKNTPREFALHKDYWILQVHRKDALLRLADVLRPYIQHPKRKADMKRVLQNVRERNASPNLKFTPRSHRIWVSKL